MRGYKRFEWQLAVGASLIVMLAALNSMAASNATKTFFMSPTLENVLSAPEASVTPDVELVSHAATGEGMCTGCGDSVGCGDCCSNYSLCEVVRESVCGDPNPSRWTPLPLSNLLSEGWFEPWIPSPNGSGGAPRQGWINAADGNMYRLWFFTFAQGFNDAPQEDAYLGAYTLLTPLSRRLMLITNVPFAMRNNVSGGLPTVEPSEPGAVQQSQSGFGDVSLTPRVLLHETRDFSLTADLTIVTPTGDDPLAGKSALVPTIAFWHNIAGGWVVRGGIGDLIPTEGDSSNTLISQLAIGQTLTSHDVPLFGDFTYYFSAVANTPLSSDDSTSVTLTPGIRSHLGNDWYFLAGMPTPLTETRVAELGMIFWFMNAW